MILWHVETVAVDEGGLYQRTSGFSKAECDKLPLHHPQESQVGMILARKGLRNGGRDVVTSKLHLLPLARSDHIPGKQANLSLLARARRSISPSRGNLNLSIAPRSGFDKVPFDQALRGLPQVRGKVLQNDARTLQPSENLFIPVSSRL